jgi:hypothetical protein
MTRHEDPRQAFYKDLCEEAMRWKELGDHLIIGIDANEDVRKVATFEAFRTLGMHEAILHTHYSRSPPATCDKNMSRAPIDGIFVTPSIRITAGGYSPFNTGCPSDHRLLWIDFTYQDAFGFSIPPHVAPSARWLQTKNPKLVARYNTQLALTLDDEGLDTALLDITTRAQAQGWSSDLERQYNTINDRQYEARQNIETKLRHLRTGGIPWSPKLERCRNDIQIWSLLVKKRQNRRISNRKLRRLLVKSSITNAYSKTLPELEDELEKAFQEYKKAVDKSANWRDEFLATLAASRAEAKGTDKDTELKQLRTIEQQRTMARNVKRMRGKLPELYLS